MEVPRGLAQGSEIVHKGAPKSELFGPFFTIAVLALLQSQSSLVSHTCDNFQSTHPPESPAALSGGTSNSSECFGEKRGIRGGLQQSLPFAAFRHSRSLVRCSRCFHTSDKTLESQDSINGPLVGFSLSRIRRKRGRGRLRSPCGCASREERLIAQRLEGLRILSFDRYLN